MEAMTSIADIELALNTQINLDIDMENLDEVILDFTLDEQVRFDAFEQRYIQIGDEIVDVLGRLTGMYQISGLSIVQKFLYRLCSHGDISLFLKMECVRSLLSFEEYEDDDTVPEEVENIRLRNNARLQQGYKALNYVCYDIKDPTPCRVDAIVLLMKSPEHVNQSTIYFGEMLCDTLIPCEYRYKAILDLEQKDILEKEMQIEKACLEFINFGENEMMYRILSAQKLLQDIKPDEEVENKVSNTILSFAKNPETEYNLRADAADLLLSLGDAEMKAKGREIIEELGAAYGDVKTVFDNAQNVHNVAIEKSVIDALTSLAEVPLDQIDDQPITLEYVKEQIVELLEKHEDSRKEAVQLALTRITMDRALYSHMNFTLKKILLHVWSFISANQYKEDLEVRLIEELEDMAGICSSGFASRLVNVMSGYGDFSLRISFEDQVVGNFVGRLNALARGIAEPGSKYSKSQLEEVVRLWLLTDMQRMLRLETYKDFLEEEKIRKEMEGGPVQPRHLADEEKVKKDPQVLSELMGEMVEEVKARADISSECLEDFAEAVLNEMAIAGSDWGGRQNFLLFFRTEMLPIREEMYKEFKDHLRDDEFDLYFRKALAKYEATS